MTTPYTLILAATALYMSLLLFDTNPLLSGFAGAFAMQPYIELAKDAMRPRWQRWRQKRMERAERYYTLVTK